jgi:thiol-disulfide isomerase/thioredoxin
MKRMTKVSAYLAVLAVVTMFGCSKKEQGKESPVEPVKPPTSQILKTNNPPEVSQSWTWYRVDLISKTPPAEVPFFLKVPSPETKGVAEIHVGEESLAVPVVWKGASSFELDFEILQAKMEAVVAENGLTGRWVHDSGSWGLSEQAIRGVVVDDQKPWQLFPLTGPPVQAAPTSANWRLEMPDSGLAQLSLLVEAESAHGTLLFETGNRISLAGRVGPKEVKLAGFDGTSAYLLTAQKNSNDALKSGQWMAGPSLAWQEAFTGQSAPNFTLDVGPTFRSKNQMKIAGVNFKEYLGKPTIIELAGSWCITCRYAAPFLREIYAEFHPKGLEMLTLAYEFTDDEAYNNAQAKEFKEQYSVGWEVTAVHGAPESFSEIMPKGLKGIDASGFPISIFVDREGRVTYVHAGFPASKDGEDYKALVGEYRAEVLKLLGSAP